MRRRKSRLAALSLVLVLAGCASNSVDLAPIAPSSPPIGAVIFAGPAEERFYWDLRDGNLSLAWVGGFYPGLPDAELSLSCPRSGRMSVDMSGSRVATDVGRVQPSKLGLSGGSFRVLSAPTWRYTGFDAYPSLILEVTTDQLATLLEATDFVVSTQYGEGSDAKVSEERYAPPPIAMAKRFLADCVSMPAASR